MIPGAKKKKSGRPVDHGVMLTLEQFNWLSSTLNKRVALMEKVKSQPKLKAVLGSVADKVFAAQELTPGNFAVSCNRQELRVLGDIVGNTVTALKEKVLPAYEKGVKRDAAVYTQRAAQAQELYKELKQLSKKIEGVYDAGSHRRNSDF